MKRKPRMVKMLACLICSMSGAAALLAWIEPQPGGSLADPAGLAQFTHELVGGAAVHTPRSWHTVELVYDPSAPLSRNGLLATGGDDHHFRIDPDGSLGCSQRWQRQSSFPHQGAAGVIRVVVTGRGDAGRVPDAQWRALRALLTELDHTCAERGDLVRLVLTPTPAAAGGARDASTHLRRLVATISPSSR